MKVRLKKEIVALGVDGISPTKKVGNMLIQKTGTSLLMIQIQLLLIQEIIMRLILVLLKIQLTLKQRHLGNFLLCRKKSQR